jgi:hypothetical protein
VVAVSLGFGDAARTGVGGRRWPNRFAGPGWAEPNANATRAGTAAKADPS